MNVDWRQMMRTAPARMALWGTSWLVAAALLLVLLVAVL